MDRERLEAELTASASSVLEDFIARVRPDGSGLTAELDSAAIQVFEAFEVHGVGALLLKGPALANSLYTPSERRNYSDVDLLVAPGDLLKARKVMGELGYRNASEALGIDDIGEVVHEESWIGMPPGATYELVVELHLRLAGSKASPQVAWDVLEVQRTSTELRGRSVPALGREGLAMHLAMHAAQHGPQYEKGCRELALGLERWPFPVWERAATLAREIGASDAYAAGLRLVPAGGRLAETLALPPTSRLDWEIKQRARPRGTFHLEALLQARSMRARVDVLRRALLPGHRWMAWQYPWARGGTGRLVAAYALHLTRTPLWAVRAWWFQRRARRSG